MPAEVKTKWITSKFNQVNYFIRACSLFWFDLNSMATGPIIYFHEVALTMTTGNIKKIFKTTNLINPKILFSSLSVSPPSGYAKINW